MRILWVLLAVLATTVAVPTDFPDEDHTLSLGSQETFTLPFEVPTGMPNVEETVAFVPVESQDLTTVPQELILTSPLPAVEVETTNPLTTPKARKTSTSLRPTSTRSKEATSVPVTKSVPTRAGPNKQIDSTTAVSQRTSPSTATSKKFDEDNFGSERGKNEKLSDFLKRKKQERFLATTEADPFAAFFANVKTTTTSRPPFREETSSPSHSESFSSSGRSFSGPSKNRPGNRRNAAFGRTVQQASTSTTSEPRPTPTAKPRNRFTGFPRNSKSGRAAPATTPDTFVIEKPEPIVETSTRGKSFTKRPSVVRPVPNSISRKRDQTSSQSETSSAATETVGESPVETNPKTTTRRGSIRRVKGNRL